MIFIALILHAVSEISIDTSSDGLELYITGDGSITQSIARKKGNYQSIIKVSINGPSALGNNAFESFTSMTSITLADTVTSILSECFKGCSKLTEFTFPPNIVSINSGLFWSCISLTTVRINASVASIDTYTLFLGCKSLNKFEVSLGNQFLTTDDSLSFLLSKNGTVLYSAPGTKVQVIPSTVKQINSNCYYSLTITSIDFSKSQLETVSSYGFRQLTIDSLVFPNTLLRIYSSAFYQSKINSLSFPSSLIYFDSQVLNGIVTLNKMTAEDSAALKSENGIITDGDKKVIFFIDPSIDTIIIGPTIEQIEKSRIIVSNVVNVTVLPGNLNLSSHDCVLYNRDGTSLLAAPGGKENVTVYSKCKTINSESFFQCKVKNVILNEGLESINFRAFGWSTIRSINFPSSLKYLRSYVFSYCTNLNIDISLGSNILSIDNNCFEGCELVSINMIQCTSLTTIREYTFRLCKAASISLPPNLISLSYGAFQSSSIQSIVFPSSLNSIAEYCFQDCSQLSSISIMNTQIIAITEYCLANSAITKVVIPKSVVSLKSNAFKDCVQLTSINFENDSTLNEISSGIIDGCSSLVSFYIPDSVNSITEGAFSNANGLLNFETKANLIYEAVDGILLKNSRREIFAFPAGRSSVIIDDSIQTLSKLSFSYCTKLNSVTFGENSLITSIPENAFLGCTNLKSVTLPSALVELDPTGFSGCYSITSIRFAGVSNLKTIQSGTFRNYELLSYFGFDMAPELSIIGDSAFEGCSKLNSIKLPKIEQIGSQAFFGCSSLTSIKLSQTLQKLGSDAFGSCTQLSTFIYCGNLAFIDTVFSGSNKLQSVLVPYEYETDTFGGVRVLRCLDSDCHTSTTIFTEESNNISSSVLLLATASLSDS